MIQAEIKKYFKYHNSNMKLLKIGFVEIREQVKSLYKNKQKQVIIFIRCPMKMTEK